jgi:solute carrier family 25 carnitine/acylcarnitine transporter 20/29
MQNALLMGGYGIGKQWASDNKDGNDDDDQKAAITLTLLMSVFVGGCTGGLIQSFFMSPVELMKVNQQVVGKSAKAAGMELVQGLNSRNKSWRGLNATLLRDGIPHGVWFASYEWCKTVLGERLKGSTGEQVTVPLASGAFAATVAWVCVVFCILCGQNTLVQNVPATRLKLTTLFGSSSCSFFFRWT